MTIQIPGEENEIQKFPWLFILHPFSYLHNMGREMQYSTSFKDAQKIHFVSVAKIILNLHLNF